MNIILTAALLLAIWVLGRILVILYRLTWHPLAKFPGPKWAAVTSAYELYYDAIKGGQYTFEIIRMHEKYGKSLILDLLRSTFLANYPCQGPVVRISPSELHISEPGFIDELYPGPGKIRDKYSYATGQFG